MKRLAVCCWFLFTLTANTSAQTEARQPIATGNGQGENPPLTLYFRFDRADVNTHYMNNAHSLARLAGLLTDSALTTRIDSVGIFSFASPDGQQAYNRALASRRSASVRKYLLRNYPRLDARCIHSRPQGENWQGLRDLILSNDRLPLRDRVIRIIDSTPDGTRCKLLLKRLDGGCPYRYIARHILPQLRNASVCVVYLRAPLPPMNETTAEGAGLAHATGYKDKKASGGTDANSDAGNMAAFNGSNAYPGFPMPFQTVTHKVRRPLLAVKTNLLFDLAMAPNIEIEVPLDKRNRWSVVAEWTFPWWLFEGDKYCFQVLSGGVEGRYWLGNREKHHVLTGHFVGFYAGGGKYDLQWDRNGYQGEFYIASGVSYGYALPIARNLRLEMSIGIGLMKTSYEHYHTLDNYNTLLWQNNGRYTWLGPTKAKVSLVWMLNRKVKVIQKGGAR